MAKPPTQSEALRYLANRKAKQFGNRKQNAAFRKIVKEQSIVVSRVRRSIRAGGNSETIVYDDRGGIIWSGLSSKIPPQIKRAIIAAGMPCI